MEKNKERVWIWIERAPAFNTSSLLLKYGSQGFQHCKSDLKDVKKKELEKNEIRKKEVKDQNDTVKQTLG